MKFNIVTPERVVYQNEITQVSLPTTMGEITILPHHVPLISTLAAGEMRIKDTSGEQVIAVAGGFVEVRQNGDVTVMADNAERAEEIDIAKAEAARARAEQEMQKAQHAADVDFTRLQAVLDRELNRIRVGKKYRKLPL